MCGLPKLRLTAAVCNQLSRLARARLLNHAGVSKRLKTTLCTHRPSVSSRFPKAETSSLGPWASSPGLQPRADRQPAAPRPSGSMPPLPGSHTQSSVPALGGADSRCARTICVRLTSAAAHAHSLARQRREDAGGDDTKTVSHPYL